MEYRILGPLEVVDGVRTIRVAGAKQRALLAVLLTHANEVVARDRLIDELWGDHPPDTAAAALQVHVSQLRKALERRDGADREPETHIVTKAPGYVLKVANGELDRHRFERLVGEGRKALRDERPEVAADRLHEALALWRGTPFGEFGSTPSATIERGRLEELHLAALEDRIEAELRLGEHGALIPELEALVREHGLRERLRGQLMLALYRAGRQADALDVYREGRRLLTDGLGLEPGDELRRLERAILAQDSALAAPAAPLVRRLGVAGRRRSRLLILAGAVIVASAAAALVVALTTGSGNAAVTVAPNSVAVVDAKSGLVVADVPIGGRPVAIAIGEGAVWVTNADDGTLLRIDPRTRRVVETIGLGGDVNYVATGFGSVWVAGGNDETLYRIDPRRNAVEATLRFGTTDPLAPEPVFFVATGEKAVWITRGNHLLGIDPTTNGVVADVPVNTPLDIATGGGDIWITTLDEHLLRVDEATKALTASLPLPYSGASPVYMRAELWLLVLTQTAQAWRLEPSSLAQTGAVAFPSGFPLALAAGGADLWVIDHTSGALSRIDRAGTTSTLVAKVGWHPISVAATADLVWVGVQRDHFK